MIGRTRQIIGPLCAVLWAAPPQWAHAGEPPSVWVAQTVRLDESVEADTATAVGDAYAEALRTLGVPVVTGAQPLIQAAKTHETARHFESARKLVERGESLYMRFEFGPAAASLAEAATLLTVALSELEPQEAELLFRARSLEGVAWFEGGQPAAAKSAFAKLINLRPTFMADPSLLSPGAMELFEQARSEVHALGTTSLEVRSEPAGAAVILDGQARGRTPVSIPDVPAGTHGLNVSMDGYQTQSMEVVLQRGTPWVRTIQMTLSPAHSALRRVVMAGKQGQPESGVRDELALLHKTTGIPSLVLLGVALRHGRTLVTAIRADTQVRSAVVVTLFGPPTAEQFAAPAASLLADTLPARQFPEGPPVNVDFDRALLGVGPGWGGEVAETAAPWYRSWWFWTGVGVVAAVVGTVVWTTREGEPGPDRTGIILVFG